jgi:uncharacterized YigZ family protein
MEIDQYNSILETSEGFFKDKGSKFFAFAFHVTNEEEINLRREELKKKYYDARHHVYAFMLGADKQTFRSSDDGEPSNSSGPPILGQIRSHDLSDILIVVIRYFGGTKLGIPGLINAYRTAADDAIKNAKVVIKTVKQKIILKFEYSQMNNVMRFIKEENLDIFSQNMQISCEIIVEVRKSETEKVLEKLKNFHEIKVGLG